MAQKARTIKKRPDNLYDFKMKNFYYYDLSERSKKQAMWHSTWGRWTTSRICDPSGKDSPSNSQWAEECSARRVLSHRPFHLQFPGCNLWILDYWCLLASDLPSSYVWTPGLSRLPHPAVPLLLWMLHVFNFPLVYKLWSTILRIFLSSFFPPIPRSF